MHPNYAFPNKYNIRRCSWQGREVVHCQAVLMQPPHACMYPSVLSYPRPDTAATKHRLRDCRSSPAHGTTSLPWCWITVEHGLSRPRMEPAASTGSDISRDGHIGHGSDATRSSAQCRGCRRGVWSHHQNSTPQFQYDVFAFPVRSTCRALGGRCYICASPVAAC